MTRLRDRLAEWAAGDLIARRVSEAVTAVETRLGALAETRAREAYSAGMSRVDQQLAEQGFRRLSGTYSTRDLSPIAQDAMLELAYWLWESNPLAQWLVEVIVDFVWGEGGAIKAEDAKADVVVQEFWADPVNQLERRADDFIREIGLQGELCLPVFVNEVDGHVRLGYIDPCEIDQVVTDLDNRLIQRTVVLKGSTGRDKRYLKVVREETWRASPNYGLLMPAEPGEADSQLGRRYDGSCLLVQVNKLSGAQRGRSDLLPLIDWLDGYDDAMLDQLDRARQLDSYVWDVTLKGQTEEQITAWLAKNGRIRRGMVRAHNEQVEWDAVSPDIKAADKDTLFRLIRGHMLGSRSLPEHYYGLGGDVNLATAKEMGLPTVKRMTRRQKVVRWMFGDWGRFAIHQAKRAGRLPESTSDKVTMTLPEISMRDTAVITTALTSLTVALTQAETQGWIRKKTARRLFALMASQLGAEIDPEEEGQDGAPSDTQTQDYTRDNVRRLRDRSVEPEP